MRRLLVCVVSLAGCSSFFHGPDYSQMSTTKLMDIEAEREPICPSRPFGCPDPPLYPPGGAMYGACVSWQNCQLAHNAWWLRTRQAAKELDRRESAGEK